MTATNDRKVVGHAVYIELISSDRKSLAQFLLTPEAKLSNGYLVGSARLFRIIRAFQTRGNWSLGMNMSLYDRLKRRITPGEFPSPGQPFPTEDEFLRGHNVTSEIREFLYKEIVQDSHIKYIDSFMNPTSTSWQWSFSGDPFVVPVTEGDLKVAYHRQTPQNLMNRVKKIREAKGFPERVFDPVSRTWTFQYPAEISEEPSLV